MISLPASPWRPLLALLPILMGGLLLSSDLAAQQQLEGEVTFQGAVIDQSTGVAIPGASVRVGYAERRAFTNRDGRFSLDDLEPGTHPVVITQLGYDTLRTEISFDEKSQPTTFRMVPDPVVLERITALVDRLEEQRNSVGYSVRVFDQPRLQSSTDYTVLEFLQARTVLRLTRCPGRGAMGPCAEIRGRAMPVEVYLDGARVVGGLDVLSAYRPEEMYAVEVLAGGRAIRAFTTWYVETVAEGRRLPPVFLF